MISESVIEQTPAKPQSQNTKIPHQMEKYKRGTSAILLVSAKKSAAVSMIAIEILRDLKLQHITK